MSGISNCKLLIADDQPLMRDTLRDVLRRRNVEVDAAHDGEEAMRYLNTEATYAAAILDQDMPGARGLEVIKCVRSGWTKVPHKLPVMLITGHGEVTVVKTAASLDVDAFLGKPFTIKALLQRLEKALLDRPPRKSANAYASVSLPMPCRAKHLDPLAGPSVVLPGKPLWVTTADMQSSGTPQAGSKHAVPVTDLVSGMVLGQALYSGSGQLMAGPGLTLNERMICKIQARAADLGEDGYIDIIKPAGTG